MMLLLARCIFF